MDNMSSVGGESFSGVPERLEQDFGPSEFEQRAEQRQFTGQAELGRGVLEIESQAPDSQFATETEAAALGYGDANAQMTEVGGKLLGTDLGSKVKDGDSLEADIVAQVQRIGDEIEKDPHQGLLDFSKLREEYMLKRWNRVLGDRNDGSKDASLNATGNQKAQVIQFPGARKEQRKAA